MKSNVWRGFLVGSGLLGFGALGAAIASEGVFEQQRRPLAPPQQVKRTSVDQLVAILRTHPGGTQALATAAKGGARLSRPSKGTDLPLAGPGSELDVTLDRSQLRVGNHFASLLNVLVTADSEYRLNVPNPNGSGVVFKFDYPVHGWYIVNVVATLPPNKSISAELRQLTTSAPGPKLQAWTYSNPSPQAVTKSFPAVFEYKGSSASLKFFIMSGEVYFESVSA